MASFSTLPPLGLLWLGLLLGIRHAADPDHVVAVGAIAARTRRLGPAVRLGVAWGAGHTLTLFVVASGIVLFKLVVPPRVGLGLEFCVAIALVVLGLLNMGTHRNDYAETSATSGPLRAFVVGLVHGLAGSAAVALLVVATVGDARWASAYLLMFGLGTLLGMTTITAGIAWPIAAAVSQWRLGTPLIRFATGTLSIAMGLWLAYDIAWNDGLFRAVATWTPR